MGTHSDFLSGFVHEKRAHVRRPARVDVILLYLRKGLRGCLSQRAMTVDLSEGGCMISCPKADVVSEHLYVIIAGVKARIACAVVGRSETRLHLRFSDNLPTEIVDSLTKRRH
jgi:hypothetical protein